MDRLKLGLVDIVEAEQPMTVRGVFYRSVAAGLIAKTDPSYKVISRLLLQLRRDGVIPYSWITDGTRWQIKPRSFNGMEDARIAMVRMFRRALWNDQDAYVEVFAEKDAIAGILSAVTSECSSSKCDRICENRARVRATVATHQASSLRRARLRVT